MTTMTESVPSLEQIVTKIESIKIAKGLSWAELAGKIGQAPVWVAAALTGQCSMSAEDCAAIADDLELTEMECKVLQGYPYRGSLPQAIPSDPFVYRFYEIMQVYGIAMKQVTQEEFGDGIMSAIDFSIDVEREPDPKGDRVKITFSGKFLPYKKF
ncbi:cyanase [Neorhodopirellula pilleata]|uniref:Cyanate hydratase n=1 Tax=Neorhodopirellula pilleata TaxID=2714738 RepID=A0A5C6A8K6_9BACT|nr:cyanase [Neorhodopirellula pilleata]TWT95727.1 Cyanate hydratase [Neorhodopirellula pilleata]